MEVVALLEVLPADGEDRVLCVFGVATEVVGVQGVFLLEEGEVVLVLDAQHAEGVEGEAVAVIQAVVH